MPEMTPALGRYREDREHIVVPVILQSTCLENIRVQRIVNPWDPGAVKESPKAKKGAGTGCMRGITHPRTKRYGQRTLPTLTVQPTALRAPDFGGYSPLFFLSTLKKRVKNEWKVCLQIAVSMG